MVLMNVLANALKSINNAEKCGKVKFSKVMLQFFNSSKIWGLA
uniref:Uncharacterized protein n=1 Tax=Gopherus agassizii TaxID=38772 RepID=A0A452J4Y9_9SAUR